MRAFANRDWPSVRTATSIRNLETNPNIPDAYYYMGEAARLSGNKNQALMNYEKAMNLDPKFAAAILAHAKLLKAVKPKSNILDDLDKAIKYDPYSGRCLHRPGHMRIWIRTNSTWPWMI